MFTGQVEICLEAMTRASGIPANVLKSHRRDHAIAHPRQIAMLVAREMTGKSYPVIGRAFGNRDHSTVMYGIQQAREKIRKNPDAEDLYRSCTTISAQMMGQLA